MLIKKENYRVFEIKRMAYFESPDPLPSKSTIKADLDRKNNETTFTTNEMVDNSRIKPEVKDEIKAIESSKQIAQEGVPLAQAAVELTVIPPVGEIGKQEAEIINEKIKKCIEALQQKNPPPRINELIFALESKSDLFTNIVDINIPDQIEAVKLYLSGLFEKAGVGKITEITPGEMNDDVKISPTFSISGIQNIKGVNTTVDYRYSLKSIANGERFNIGILPAKTDKNQLGKKAAEAGWNRACPTNKVEDLINLLIELNKFSVGVRSDAKK